MTTTADPGYVSVTEAATALRVHPRTIRRAVTRGELIAYRIGPRGQLRIPQWSLAALLQPVRQPEETTR